MRSDNKHFDILVTEMLQSFSIAYKGIKPLLRKPHHHEDLADILSKLRHRMLDLLHEARNA